MKMKTYQNHVRHVKTVVFVVIIKYNLYSNAHPTLFITYQYLLTLPVTQKACERSFSTLKYLKKQGEKFNDNRTFGVLHVDVD